MAKVHILSSNLSHYVSSSSVPIISPCPFPRCCRRRDEILHAIPQQPLFKPYVVPTHCRVVRLFTAEVPPLTPSSSQLAPTSSHPHIICSSFTDAGSNYGGGLVTPLIQLCHMCLTHLDFPELTTSLPPLTTPPGGPLSWTQNCQGLLRLSVIFIRTYHFYTSITNLRTMDTYSMHCSYA